MQTAAEEDDNPNDDEDIIVVKCRVPEDEQKVIDFQNEQVSLYT